MRDDMLALKLVLTPCLIAAATLAGRRWGPWVSGWLIGFPLTSGPVSVFLYLQYGPLFASQSVVGTLAGQASAFFLMMGALLPAVPAFWTYLLALLVNGLVLRLARQ